MNSINESKTEDFKEVLKIDEELEKKEKILIGSPIKKNNYASNPNEVDINCLNLLNDSTEKLNVNNMITEKPNLINSMKDKNKNYDFINFSIEDINKSKY